MRFLKPLTLLGICLFAGYLFFSQNSRSPASVTPAVRETSAPNLDRQIETMLEKSFPRMVCNLSVGAPGSIIASPESHDPNYYYHWIRDSAIIVKSLVQLLPFVQGTQNEKLIRQFIGDFAAFSEKLQSSSPPYGPGETRFLVDGAIDTSEWPRPQYDGIALRAIAMMSYLKTSPTALTRPETARLQRLILRDLDDISRFYNTRGFDLWEYANGFHFFTRMAQLHALQEGSVLFPSRARSWSAAARELTTQLATHWHPETGVITWGGPVTDSHDRPIPINFASYDTSVSLAMVHAAPAGGFDDLDERVWSSLWKQEDYFLRRFPVNAGKVEGPAIGRDPGDSYYGGNAFFFLTAAYGEHSFRAARALRFRQGVMTASTFNIPRLQHLLRRPVPIGTRIPLPNAELAQAFAREGDAFLQTMLNVIPADGMMAEQMSKIDGAPVSARDLTWSYASILTAVLERERWTRSSVDFRKLKFACPQ